MQRVTDQNGVVHNFPDEATPEMIQQALGLSVPSLTGDSTVRRAMPPQEPVGRAAVHALVRGLPMYGGVAGGLLGGMAGSPLPLAGSVAGAGIGAGLGGAAGESARQGLSSMLGFSDAPQNPVESATGIAREAALQPAYEVGGRLLQFGAKAGARNLMRRALRPSASAQRAAGANITREARALYPNPEELWRDFQREGLTVSGGTANKLQERARILADQKATKLAAEPKLFTVFDLTSGPEIAQMRQEIARSTSPQKNLAAFENKLHEFVSGHKTNGKLNKYTATELDKLRGQWFEEAAPVLNAIKNKQGVPAGSKLEADFAHSVASRARRQLENISGVGELNARLQRTGRMESAVSDAMRRNPPMAVPLAAGGAGAYYGHSLGAGALAALAGHLISTPQGLSALSLALGHPVTQAAVRFGPRLAGMGLQGMMNSTSQDELPPGAFTPMPGDTTQFWNR